jgi:hypothetical protein
MGPLLERKTGFEPATLALARRCSTPEPLPRSQIQRAEDIVPCVKAEFNRSVFSRFRMTDP